MLRGRVAPLERVPVAWTHAIEKDSLKINGLEHVLAGKPLRTFLRTCSKQAEGKIVDAPPSAA